VIDTEEADYYREENSDAHLYIFCNCKENRRMWMRKKNKEEISIG
jgi:hypothetical protein